MTEKTLGADAAAVDLAGSSAPDQLTHAAPTHTPAPWTFFVGKKVNVAEPHIKHFVGANGQGFALTVGLGLGEDAANAHLIAAAPELLDVVKACAPLWDLGLSDAIKTFVLRHHEHVSFDELGERVKGAIAKAEGRS